MKTEDKKNTVRPDPIWVKVYRLLHPSERRNFALLNVLSLVTAIAQSFGIASFLPFMNLAMNLNSIHENKYLNWAYQTFHFQSERNFVIVSGIVVAVLILISNFLAILNNMYKNRFILNVTYKMSRRLLKHYLYKPYDFILQRNSSELVKGVISDVNEFTNGFLNGIVELIINLLMMVSVLALLLFVNVKVTLYILVFFALIYGSLTMLTKSRLRKNGIKVMNGNRDRQKYAYEALNGFKILKTLGIEDYFIERYSQASKKTAKYQLFSKTISTIPKNIIETIIFCGLSVLLVLVIIQQRDIQSIIPMLSVYVIAGYRIMPEVAKVFASISNIIHNQPIVDRLYNELVVDSKNELQQLPYGQTRFTCEPLAFEKQLLVKDVIFKYNQSENIINQITVEIPRGSVIGFAGTTGAGKTTLIDIMMGLLQPQSGALYVDGVRLSADNARNWRSIIGYVPQEIFLIDDTVKANIAFGIQPQDIDDEKIRMVAKIAAISDFIENELPDQYNSMIGERGVRLSGGQRQRLGLARALYRNPQVLILDEATSALDGATEETVVSSIHSLSQVKTIIIIAHRLNTLKPCSQIYLLEHGQVVDHGTYDELINNNDKFRKMAKIER